MQRVRTPAHGRHRRRPDRGGARPFPGPRAQLCKACGPLLAEAEAGRNWLKGLTEVEPPASLVNNILASTTGVDTQRLRTAAPARQPHVSWREHVQASFLGPEPIWAMVRQPRFAMSFGMAFFALSVGLTVAGVKPSDLRQISLRPSAIRHTYYNTQARVVRYYDNVPVRLSSCSRALRELQAQPHPAEARTGQNRKNTRTTQHNSPSRSRSAITARLKINSFWPALRWVHLFAICL